MGTLNPEFISYNRSLRSPDSEIADRVAEIINENLSCETKIWHAHPVWFVDGNPIVGYSKLKDGIRLLFWSGQSFDEPALRPEGKFKAAEIRYANIGQVDETDIKRWLRKSLEIQWDYKNIVKRKGVLLRLC